MWPLRAGQPGCRATYRERAPPTARVASVSTGDGDSGGEVLAELRGGCRQPRGHSLGLLCLPLFSPRLALLGPVPPFLVSSQVCLEVGGQGAHAGGTSLCGLGAEHLAGISALPPLKVQLRPLHELSVPRTPGCAQCLMSCFEPQGCYRCLGWGAGEPLLLSPSGVYSKGQTPWKTRRCPLGLSVHEGRECTLETNSFRGKLWETGVSPGQR